MQYVNDATRPRVIRGNMDPPAGATMVGIHSSGVPIYEEEVQKYKTVPMLDALRKPVYLMRGGQAIRAITQQVEDGTEKRQFVLNDLGNGVVQKNYDFEVSEEEKARIEAAAAASPEAVLKRLAEFETAFRALGLTPEDLATAKKSADA